VNGNCTLSSIEPLNATSFRGCGIEGITTIPRQTKTEKDITMHPRTKRHLLQITKPLARLMAGYGVLIMFAILAVLALILLP
jgi:acetolactate synthase small subunit